MCGKEFKVKPSRVDKAKYCSYECAYKALNKQIEKECTVCGKRFKVPNNDQRRNAKYCSQECFHKVNIGKNHGMYKHGYGRNGTPEQRKLAYKKHYQKYRKQMYNEHRHKRLLKLNAEGYHTHQEWEELLKKHDWKCFYCGTELTDDKSSRQATRDHRIPIMREGNDNIENIVPACKSCNSSKGNMTDIEYILYRQRVTR